MEEFHSGRIEVDGEIFEVSAQEGLPGQHNLRWLSGPNPGYGFTCRRSDVRLSTRAQLIEQIRDFLAQIDPDTGYIA